MIEDLDRQHFTVAVETNGTITGREGVDWVGVSPKAGTKIVVIKGNELKVVFLKRSIPESMIISSSSTSSFNIQPIDGPAQTEYLNASVDFCMANPKWPLSLQTHEILGIR